MLSAQTMRPSPYTIPPPRIHSMQSMHRSPYSTHFTASAYNPSTVPSTFFQSAMFPHNFSSSLSSSVGSTSLPSTPTQLLSPSDTSDPMSGLHTDSNGDTTPITTNSPGGMGGSEGEQAPNSIKLPCAYSSSLLANGSLSGGGGGGGGCRGEGGEVGSLNACCSESTTPLASPMSTSLPGLPLQTSMLPTSMYTPSHHPHQHHPHQDYSTTVNMGMNLSSPSLSQLPVWNTYPSLPMNTLPSTIPKLSYDTPRYKLTPERAIPLIKWFEEHKEHPYPTRHEKILLCQSTQLTFTQVSTWFANARRRMKKASSEEDKSSSSDDCSQNGEDSPLSNEEVDLFIRSGNYTYNTDRLEHLRL